MAKIQKTNISKTKKIIIITLSIPLFLIGLLILGIAITSLVTPILEKIDQDKFTTLDSQMQIVYNKLKTTSVGVDDWKYAAVCSTNLVGDFPNGTYNCVTSISLQKTITDVDQLNQLQAKYFPVIDNSSVLRAKSDLDKQLPSDFGQKFVVSSAEKRYEEVKTGIECRYLLELNQVKGISLISEGSVSGKTLDEGKGAVTLTFNCSEKARSYWYPRVSSTSDIVPKLDYVDY